MHTLTFILTLLTSFFLLSSSEPDVPQDVTSNEVSGVASADSPAEERTSTFYNGIEVPPITMLNGETFEDDTKDGYWLIKLFSPYCDHCKKMAPFWQALYEIYYTSNPLPLSQESSEDNLSPSTSLNSFTRFYNFKFAKLDCTAYGGRCSSLGVKAYPTVILFKDGKQVKGLQGGYNLQELSGWLEERLESIKPGSRPKGGIPLPAQNDENSAEASPPEPDTKEDTSSDAETNRDKKSESKNESPASEKANSGVSDDAPVKPPEKHFNPDGQSKQLTMDTFHSQVTSTLDPWFIKFYAPWCPHCQKMAPNWAEMAKEMRGKLNIGEVNCDIEGRLCKDVHARAFPTILYFRGGERVEYGGLRGVGDFINYANSAVDIGSGVQDVDAAAFEQLEETDEVIFLYFHDHAATSEDFAALDRLTLSLIGHARLVKTNDPKLYDRFQISTWPSLVVSREGKPIHYDGLSPKDMRDTQQLLGWMKTVWQPILPELTGLNAPDIMANNIVVLGILSRDRSDEFISSKRELKEAAFEWMERETAAFKLERDELRNAKQLRIEEAEDRNDERAVRAAKQIRLDMNELKRKKVVFAWVDGIFWQRWVRTTFGIDVNIDGERIIINDEENRRYWDTTLSGNPIVPSRFYISETLPKVVSNPPQIQSKSSASSVEHVYMQVRNVYSSHPFLGVSCTVIILLSLAIWGKGVIVRSKRRGGLSLGTSNGSVSGAGNGPGYFHLDVKEGLLGTVTGNANGKFD